ncbi:AIG2-like family-domain-containing protein [Protomyces lactucae-debilis]|uniref:Putative gamma-glutamylcyclotransferase n=1 Tax=Protomyces lactucae-debilis TaxID=2754530 RepID=A0A1Y2F559_PROLT|nr:AIG2-like family-domain-containing protein [Protomyces lactucae-debilis]ORY79058.1 AIG2-like family-domain-containing protein [Protomyces lactucae-debilis]
MTSYSCFFYGTLMHPAVLNRVISSTETPAYLPVILPGYARFRVKGQDYPGVIAAQDAPEGSVAEANVSVAGMLVSHLSSYAIKRLDAFEGDEYTRTSVTVLDGTGKRHNCQMYLYKDSSKLEATVWDFEDFKREKLAHWTGDAEFSMLQGQTDGTNGRSSFA